MPTELNHALEPSLCIVGVGPRGTCVIERLAAIATAERIERPWMLHLVDEAPFGAGRIWRIDQVHELCMNTLTGAVTLFTDEATTAMGPVVPGPTLYEWCLLAYDTVEATRLADDVPRPHRDAFARTPLPPEFLARRHLVIEAGSVRPESHPSRALYGAYITWCFDHAVAALPPEVTVVRHVTRAVAVDRTGDGARVSLADGSVIAADDVILSLGWLDSAPSAADRELMAAVDRWANLIWVRPGSPAEQDLHRVPAGVDTIARGLGMGFFDAMALLTIGRGGRFIDDGGKLRYEATGAEPVLHVTSRRGVPFRAKSLWGGLPPTARQTHFSRFDVSRLTRPVDFETDLWPLIVQDAHAGWYRALAELSPSSFVGGTLDDVLSLIDDERLVRDGAAFGDAVSHIVPAPHDRMDLATTMRPTPSQSGSSDEFTAWVAEYIRDDLAEAHLGHDSVLKRALWEVNAARQPTAKLMGFGGATAETHASVAYRSFASFGAMIGSGPPAFRNAQLLALVEAGIVRFIGPDASLSVAPDGFSAESSAVAGSLVRAGVLVDAFMNFHDTRTSTDPIVAGLADQGLVRPHPRPMVSGGHAPGPGIDVEPGTSRIIGLDGSPVDGIHMIGLPVEDTRGDTVISPMPRINATFLREADGVAHAALRHLFPSAVTAKEALHV